MQPVQQSSEGARLTELLAFVAVAEELSFARAGKRLGRDASVLSRRVRALEARLGVRLLQRTTRAVAPTEAGRAYLQQAREILQAMDQADAMAVGFATGEVHGHLRLALPGAFGRRWLAPLVLEFLAAHPRVTIEADFSNRFVDLVAERFDLAVRVGPVLDTNLVARKIAPRRRLLCAAPSYLARCAALQHPRDLQRHDCLLFGAGLGQRWVLHGAAGQVVPVAVTGRFASEDVDTLQQAAVRGLGVLSTAEWGIGPELRAGRLVRIMPDWTVPDNGTISLVTPAGSRHATKTRAFSDFLVERLQEPPWC